MTPPPCPTPVLARLQELGLSLSHLPTVLAVYKESRERYRDLVREDYVLSWSRLLHHRWRDSSSIAVTPSQVDCLVQLLLEETQNRTPLKTVLRPSPPQQVTEGLVAGVAECREEIVKVKGRGAESLRRAWRVWKEKKGALLSVRQFISMLDLVGSDRSIEETVVDCQLIEVWDAMGVKKDDAKEDKIEDVKVKEETEDEEKDEVMFDMETISRWYSRTKNITGFPVKLARRHVTNPRLYWSNVRLEKLDLACRRARARWGRFTRERRRRWSLLKLIQIEYKKMEPGCSLSLGEITGKLISADRRRRARMAIDERGEIEEMNQGYLTFLDSETEVTTLEAMEENQEEAEEDVD